MKKFDSKKIVVAAVLLAVVIIAVLTMCSKGGAEIPADSVMAGAEGYLYYNDTKNNVVRRAIADDKNIVIAENAELLDAYMNEVVIKRDGVVSILTQDGEDTGITYEADIDDVQLTNEYIYYKEAGTGYILRIARETGECENVINMAVNKFLMYSNKIIFTTDGKMLFVYDVDTKIPMGYFGEKAIVDFDVDEDYVVYSDASNGYKVSKFNLVNGSESEFKDVKSKTIEYKNGRLFYLEDTGAEKATYKIKVNDDDVH